MENLILAAHLIIALVIIGLIMLQQGKGAEMGASFGSGGSQTLFGASGTGNFFARLTAIFATLFFVTSVSLAVIAKKQSGVDDIVPDVLLEDLEIPVIEGVSDLPEIIAEPEEAVIDPE